MSWATKKGFNYRATVAFVTDPAGTVCVPQNPLSALQLPFYTGAGGISPITLDGDTFNAGWAAGAGDDGARDRDATVDPRLSGAQSDGSGNKATFQLQAGPLPGIFKLWFGFCDQGNPTGGALNCQVQDSNVTFTSIKTTGLIPQGHVIDATGVEYFSAASWVATPDTSGVPIIVASFDTSNGIGGPLFKFAMQNTTSPLSHVAIQYIGPVPYAYMRARARTFRQGGLVMGLNVAEWF